MDLIVSFENRNTVIYKYSDYPINLFIEEKHTWKSISFEVQFPQLNPGDIIKIYVWNRTAYPCYIDDLKAAFFSINK